MSSETVFFKSFNSNLSDVLAHTFNDMHNCVMIFVDVNVLLYAPLVINDFVATHLFYLTNISSGRCISISHLDII